MLAHLSTLRSYILSNPRFARQRVGALLLLRNRIIAFGHNQAKTHPLQARYGDSRWPFLHAETSAIRNALRQVSAADLSRATLLVARLKHHNGPKSPLKFGLAKPCVGCQAAIAAFSISRTLYTNRL